jgi:hypothetical protein
MPEIRDATTHILGGAHLFAAGEHLTTRAHQFLADYVIKQVNASPLK